MSPSTRHMAMDSVQTTSKATSTDKGKRKPLRTRSAEVDDQITHQGTQPRRPLRTK